MPCSDILDDVENFLDKKSAPIPSKAHPKATASASSSKRDPSPTSVVPRRTKWLHPDFFFRAGSGNVQRYRFKVSGRFCLSLRVKLPRSRFSCTVNPLKTWRPSGTWAIPCSTIFRVALSMDRFPQMLSHSYTKRFYQPGNRAQNGGLPCSIGSDQRHTISPSFTSKLISLVAWIMP